MLINENFETPMNSPVAPSADQSVEASRQQRLIQAMNADQQEKYLHLQEEAEMLLQQLQALKRQRQQVEERQLVGTAVS